MFIDLSLPVISADAGNPEKSSRDEALVRLGHSGTHLDTILRSGVPLDYLRSRGVVLDFSAFSREREALVSDLPVDLLASGDFVLIRTGAMQRHPYGSREYRHEYTSLSWDLIDHLLKLRIRFIGIDARAIRPDADHREADIRCEQAGTFVIENMCNLEQLPVGVPFTVFTMCFDLGGSGIPCRVIAEVER